MAAQEPSKVIHVHNVGRETSRNDLIRLFNAFGRVKTIFEFPAKNQALVEMQDVNSAVNAIEHYATNQPQIRGRRSADVHIVQLQFSMYEKLGDHKVGDSMLTPSFSICWDTEDGTVSSDIGVYTAVKRVREAIWARFPGVPIKNFVGFGIKNGSSDMEREEYSRIKVQLFDIPTEGKYGANLALMLQMFKIAIDNPPPAFIMLISSDTDFFQTLKRLEELGYTTLLSYSESRIEPVLKNLSDRICDWDILCKGHGFMIGNTVSSSLLLKPAPVVYIAPKGSKITGVFWNLFSCPLLDILMHCEASTFISTLPETERGITEFKAYGLKSKIPKSRWALAMTYIEATPNTSFDRVNSINNVMLADIMAFSHKNRPPCNIILVTGDQDLCPVVLFLRERNYSVTVVIPSETKDSDLLDLRDAATHIMKCPKWTDRQSAAGVSMMASISEWFDTSGQSAAW